MWFIFGLITLISFTFYAAYKRLNASWSGTKSSCDDNAYEYKVLRSKYGITGLLVGVKGPIGYDFIFKDETWSDRLFKSVGIAEEHQVGHNQFDDNVYIVSDDMQLLNHLTHQNAIINATLNIFNASPVFNCKVKQVRCNSGRLWIKFKTQSGFDENKIKEIACNVIPSLQAIKDTLAISPRQVTSKWKDPFVFRAAVFLAISTGLAINGAIHLFRLSVIKVPFTVDDNTLLLNAAILGAGLILVLMITSIVFLKKSARTHLVLIELLFIGSFGAVSTAFAELRDINIEFDTSREEQYESQVQKMRFSRGRHSTSYYLYLDDWTKESRQKKIQVSSNFYRRVSIGDYIDLKQHNGYLGMRWVKNLKKSDRKGKIPFGGFIDLNHFK